MEKLNKIQKRENLNEVFAVGEIGNGGAHHTYRVDTADTPTAVLLVVQFQDGPRKEPDSIPGVLDGDLLEIVRDRLKGFQTGPYATRENAIALTHIEEALLWMNKRVDDRIDRGVLGTKTV